MKESEDPDEQFSQYVANRRPALLRTAFLLTGEHHGAEDLVQMTFARIYAVWYKIRDWDGLDAYVRRTMVNEHVGSWRRAWRHRERSTDRLPETATAPPAFETSDLDARLWTAVQQLAPRQRAVIVLRYYEGLSESEIATTLGCSPGTVKSTASKSMARLRDQIRGPLSATDVGSLTWKEER